MQSKYDAVCKINKEEEVEQVYKNLPAVIEDEKEAIEGASFLGI